MEPTSMRFPALMRGYARRIDWSAVWTWALCFGLVAYLGLDGGGYDPLVHDQVGIAVWWVLLGGVLVGALPRRRPGTPALVALGLLAGFVLWTALSLSWTDSTEKTAADLARVAGYAGVFALALFSRGRGESQRVVAAVAAGIVVVAVVGLLSRLHPAWFSEASQTGRFLEDSERLSYPINYWNGLAGLVAIGLPLVLQVATCAKTILARALAAAAIPALTLTLFLTLSRGGIATAIVVLAIFLAFASDRLPKLLTSALGAGAGAILIVAVQQRDALREGLLNSAAHDQGDQVLLVALAACLVVGLVQAALSYALLNDKRPGWTVPGRRQALAAVVAVGAVALVVAAAVDLPGRASNGWSEFKEGGGPGSGSGRLSSAAGQNRYQFWSSAVRQNATEPLTGTGSGTFEYWWARDGDSGETVRDAHSLYAQTLGELGIVGLALLAAFMLTVLVAGARAILRADSRERDRLAAALAGCAAFCLGVAIDWTWGIPVLPVAMLLLAAVLVSGGERSAAARPLRLPLRGAFAAVALAAIVAIAIPLASTSLMRQSEAAARDGDLNAALRDAASAQNVLPGAAGPRLQEALILEEQGELAAAARAAHGAAEREPVNWRIWLVLSRLEVAQGNAAAALSDYRRARSLNPHFSLFER
jgi:hypothetical protein